MKKQTLFILSIVASCFALSMAGCGVFFGSNKVDLKSDNYEVLRLDRATGSCWTLLPQSGGLEGDETDLAFQCNETHSIISLNSMCGATAETTLESLLKNLTLGLKNASVLETKHIKIDNTDALESIFTAEGTKIKAVVLKKSGCAYDIMYISKPRVFDLKIEEFNKFMNEFHVH